MRSSASARSSRPVWPRRRVRTCSKPAASSSRLSSASAGKRPRSISATSGKTRVTQKRSSDSGANVAITIRPRGARTRAVSAKARALSTKWMTRRKTARSNQPSLNGSASAEACLNWARPPAFARACASILSDGSTPHTRAPRSARAAANRPVPDPTSRTRSPASPPCSTSSSKSCHQFSSTGRKRSYAPASGPKSGAAGPPTAADELVGVGHRLDGVLCRLERLLSDQHLLWCVSEGGRVLLDRELQLRRDPRRAQDRLDLLRLREIPRHRDLHHRCHAVRPPRVCQLLPP